MAIQNARILIRRGNEVDFDANNMQPGEWALSTDEKIVRICVAPGVCIRMATYDAFEVDMAQIEKILEECQTIEDAVKQIQSEIDAKEIVIEKYVQDAKTYSEMASDEADRAKTEADRAKTEADRALSIANIGIATTEKAGIVKPDGTTITVDADGTIHSIGGGTAGTTNYEALENKPSVNGIELSGNKTTSDLGITAESVGADAAGSASAALSNAKDYVDQSISNLVGGAPEALNTLKEISDALEESGEAVEAINQAIGNKLDKAGDSKDNTVTFTQASTRENIASTEKHSTLFGKIAKWFADLKTVAFSGSYNDLSNKPTIPTVNNATLTIKKNGSTVQTFTANASSNKTANITVPTKTSELENDSGFMGSATALDTYEEIIANTESGKFAGAKGVKEGFISLNDSLQWNEITINHTLTSGDVYGSVGTYEQLKGCKEIIVCSKYNTSVSVEEQTYCINTGGVASCWKHHEITHDSNKSTVEFDFRIDFSTGKVTGRQFIKGSSASYATLSRIYYR